MECFHVARVLYGCRDKSVHTHTGAGSTAGEFVSCMADGLSTAAAFLELITRWKGSFN